jgi:Glycosyl transferase family 2
MKISGFTIVRNAVKFDYPIVEAITSILPLCDEFVVAVGKSEDSTLELIKQIPSGKIRIIETVWDDSMREGGRTFALETDKAFQEISDDSDWCFYIQADEVLHEKYHEAVRAAMLRFKEDKSVDGLLFNYKHFYGSYDYVGESWGWYRREIRIIRNNKNIFSYKDAQGFRKRPNLKLNVKLIDACMYQYGWVKDPRLMQRKIYNWYKFYKEEAWVNNNVVQEQEFDYGVVSSLELFQETHPKVMQPRIEKMNWKFKHDISLKKYSTREKAKRFLSGLLGYRIGEYKNYKII